MYSNESLLNLYTHCKESSNSYDFFEYTSSYLKYCSQHQTIIDYIKSLTTEQINRIESRKLLINRVLKRFPKNKYNKKSLYTASNPGNKLHELYLDLKVKDSDAYTEIREIQKYDNLTSITEKNALSDAYMLFLILKDANFLECFFPKSINHSAYMLLANDDINFITADNTWARLDRFHTAVFNSKKTNKTYISYNESDHKYYYGINSIEIKTPNSVKKSKKLPLYWKVFTTIMNNNDWVKGGEIDLTKVEKATGLKRRQITKAITHSSSGLYKKIPHSRVDTGEKIFEVPERGPHTKMLIFRNALDMR